MTHNQKIHSIEIKTLALRNIANGILEELDQLKTKEGPASNPTPARRKKRVEAMSIEADIMQRILTGKKKSKKSA